MEYQTIKLKYYPMGTIKELVEGGYTVRIRRVEIKKLVHDYILEYCKSDEVSDGKEEKA